MYNRLISIFFFIERRFNDDAYNESTRINEKCSQKRVGLPDGRQLWQSRSSEALERESSRARLTLLDSRVILARRIMSPSREPSSAWIVWQGKTIFVIATAARLAGINFLSFAFPFISNLSQTFVAQHRILMFEHIRNIKR